MLSGLWDTASSSVMSAFSLGSATKGALILVGLGVAAIGLGMILKGTANVVHEIRNRDLESDASTSADESESEQSQVESDNSGSESETAESETA